MKKTDRRGVIRKRVNVQPICVRTRAVGLNNFAIRREEPWTEHT